VCHDNEQSDYEEEDSGENEIDCHDPENIDNHEIEKLEEEKQSTTNFDLLQQEPLYL
jgi:hypothetical protein